MGFQQGGELGLVGHAEDHIGLSFHVGEQGVHIFDVDMAFRKQLQDGSNAAGNVGHSNRQHGGHRHDIAAVQQDGLGPLGLVHDHAQHTVIGGLGDGNGPQVDAVFSQHLCDLGQLAGAVFQKYRDLLDAHAAFLLKFSVCR